jgi:hypothetical protein
MTFTYTLTTDLGKVRLEIGDTTSGAGVRPDGSNFSDAEVQYFLDEEGSVAGAVARACEVLATLWATVANLTVGPRREELGAVAQRYAERAAALRSGETVQAGYVTMGFATTEG